jgi:hypothetical protein
MKLRIRFPGVLRGKLFWLVIVPVRFAAVAHLDLLESGCHKDVSQAYAH